MDRRALERITKYIAMSAMIAVAASYALGGARFGTGALVGAAVALLNWASLRWILRRVQEGSARTRTALMVLLAGKMGALGAVVWVVLRVLHLDAGGFGLGLGALVVGLVVGGLGSGAPDGAVVSDAAADHAQGER